MAQTSPPPAPAPPPSSSSDEEVTKLRAARARLSAAPRAAHAEGGLRAHVSLEVGRRAHVSEFTASAARLCRAPDEPGSPRAPDGGGCLDVSPSSRALHGPALSRTRPRCRRARASSAAAARAAGPAPVLGPRPLERPPPRRLHLLAHASALRQRERRVIARGAYMHHAAHLLLGRTKHLPVAQVVLARSRGLQASLPSVERPLTLPAATESPELVNHATAVLTPGEGEPPP
jgi:hypothetical protein